MNFDESGEPEEIALPSILKKSQFTVFNSLFRQGKMIGAIVGFLFL